MAVSSRSRTSRCTGLSPVRLLSPGPTAAPDAEASPPSSTTAAPALSPPVVMCGRAGCRQERKASQRRQRVQLGRIRLDAYSDMSPALMGAPSTKRAEALLLVRVSWPSATGELKQHRGTLKLQGAVSVCVLDSCFTPPAQNTTVLLRCRIFSTRTTLVCKHNRAGSACTSERRPLPVPGRILTSTTRSPRIICPS